MFRWNSSYCENRCRSGNSSYGNKPHSRGSYMFNSSETKGNINAFSNPKTVAFQSFSRSSSAEPKAWQNGGGMTSSSSYTYTGKDIGNTYNQNSFTSTVRLEDKEELQRLNDRLSQYIIKVRQLWEQRGQIDSVAFIKSTKILEEEVIKLKGLYEHELEKIRKQLQDNARDKNNFQQQCGIYMQTIEDLKKSLSMESDKNRGLIERINGYEQEMSYLKQEITKMKSAPRAVDESPMLRKQVGDLSREREDFMGRWEKEVHFRKGIEEAFGAYKKKAEFDINVLNQQLADMTQRFEATKSTIMTMETRIRESGKSETNIKDLLRQVRLAAEEELRKYQSDAELKYSKSISALQSQLQGDAGVIGKLEQEKTQIMGSFGDLKTRIAALEAQIGAMGQEKRSLEALIAQERSMAAAQLHEMERRFKEMQSALFVKLEELNVSKESYIPLKAEIEAMKILLAEEEKRLSSPIKYTTTVKQTFHQADSSFTKQSCCENGGGWTTKSRGSVYAPGGTTTRRTYYSK
ncbi:Hypothetical predicted protein [Mytilus galloprovincialis]|uniref:IF rod domain-containing protein n=1 Tax=Mytilus galloprovincialis TaxID=29158 RepID=A0A8B6FYZ0_MYTGA|nr:Hypothetical predicted protein [Mytilus galloprovincialis]